MILLLHGKPFRVMEQSFYKGSTVRFNAGKPYDSYYIRVLYKTSYGQVYGDSEYV